MNIASQGLPPFSRERKRIMITEEKSSYRWVIFSTFVVSHLVISLAGFGWGPLAPFLKKAMGLNSTQIGLISSSFYFAAAVSAFPAGIAVDRYGVKKGIFFWLGFTGITLFFMSFIKVYLVFLIFAAIAGVGYAAGNPVASKALFMWFDQKTRGTVFGIKQASITVGAAIAGVLVIYLCERIGPFLSIRVISLAIILMMVFAIFFYHNPSEESVIPDTGSPPKVSKILDFRVLFNNIPLLFVSLYMAMLGLAQGVISTFLILYINEKLGYSLLVAGSFLSMLMIGAATGRSLWGVVSDRLFDGNRKPVLNIISVVAAVSITILAFWNSVWPGWLLMIVVIITGMSCIGWNGICLATISEISDSDKTASSIGLASTLGWAGLFIGPIVFGSLTDNFGYSYAWSFVAVFCVLSLILSMYLPIKKNI